jgi:hypothetical protein
MSSLQGTVVVRPANSLSGAQLFVFMLACMSGSFMLIISVAADSVATFDAISMSQALRNEYTIACNAATMPKQMFSGLGLLLIALVLTLIMIIILLCPCCCCKYGICSSKSTSSYCCFSQSCLSITSALFLGFCAVALFSYQIAAIAGCATFCSMCMSEIGGMESCDYCFSNGPYSPNLITSRRCPLNLARAGVGAAAGLAACAALIAAGNFAALTRASLPVAAPAYPTPTIPAATGPATGPATDNQHDAVAAAAAVAAIPAAVP